MDTARPFLKPLVLLSSGLLIGALVGFRAGAWSIAKTPDNAPQSAVESRVEAPTSPPDAPPTVAASAWIVNTPSPQPTSTIPFHMVGSKSAFVVPPQQIHLLQSEIPFYLQAPPKAPAVAPQTTPPAKP